MVLETVQTCESELYIINEWNELSLVTEVLNFTGSGISSVKVVMEVIRSEIRTIS